MRWYIPASIVLLCIIAISIFVMNTATPTEETPTTEVAPGNIPPTLVEDFGATVTLTQNYFFPANYTMPANKKLFLVITSIGAERVLSIPSLGETITVPADTLTVFKTPTLAKGELTIYCTTGCDPNVQMVVTIE